MHNPEAARWWLFSRRVDLSILAIPAVIALVSLVLIREDGQRSMPLWAFLLLIVAFDVSHVWATIYVTYLDKRAFRSRPLLYTLPIPLCFVVAYRLHSHSSSLFWTLLAYVAIYHFIQQQWGFIALYKARAQERNSFDYHCDKWTLWAGALGPVLLWHASPARQFDWFNAGESFIFSIESYLKPDILAASLAFAAVYVLRQAWLWLKHGRFNVGKNLWMLGSWISWYVGIGLAEHPLVSAAFLNLFHGIPFLAIVWFRCHRGARKEGASPLLRWLTQRKQWLAFYAIILGLAVLEELLWDGLVWKQYLPNLIGIGEQALAPHWLSLTVAFLSVPQMVHYFLDAFIWKLDQHNKDLQEALL